MPSHSMIEYLRRRDSKTLGVRVDRGRPAPSPPAELRAALEEAHLPTLLMAMATLSGDDAWLREEWRPAAPRGAEEDTSGGLPAEDQAAVRAAALELILAWRAGKPAPAPLLRQPRAAPRLPRRRRRPP